MINASHVHMHRSQRLFRHLAFPHLSCAPSPSHRFKMDKRIGKQGAIERVRSAMDQLMALIQNHLAWLQRDIHQLAIKANHLQRPRIFHSSLSNLQHRTQYVRINAIHMIPQRGTTRILTNAVKRRKLQARDIGVSIVMRPLQQHRLHHIVCNRVAFTVVMVQRDHMCLHVEIVQLSARRIPRLLLLQMIPFAVETHQSVVQTRRHLHFDEAQRMRRWQDLRNHQVSSMRHHGGGVATRHKRSRYPFATRIVVKAPRLVIKLNHSQLIHGGVHSVSGVHSRRRRFLCLLLFLAFLVQHSRYFRRLADVNRIAWKHSDIGMRLHRVDADGLRPWLVYLG
mmetsp:Transcript_19986/g.31749  ORF Transcript_19986/g.31749 Transcript_19986/m.31749 type:complete len:338 (-) Transcript_19986:603-1616(-)